MKNNVHLRTLLDFAVDAAWQAGKITLEYFQTHLTVDYKADDSPVTIADRRAEERLRQLITTYFPDHAILGEELGEVGGAAPFRWIVDPIDGTKAFVHGVPLYAVLIGLEIEGKPALGVAYFPALGEMVWAARGMGCYWNSRRAQVSSVNSLGDALLLTTDTENFAPHGKYAAYRRLVRATAEHRTWGDAYGHVLVATGRAEVMLDPVMNPWDCGPFLPILEEAGGSFTDWTGKATIHGGDAISTNGLLFDDVMALLQAEKSEMSSGA